MEKVISDDAARIAQTLERIIPADAAVLQAAQERQPQLTKPVGSLGRLEEVANRCAAICGTLTFDLSKPRIVVFAGDHGVCAEGVSPYPQIVTTQMVLNYLHGGAAINCLARSFGVELQIVDVGVIGPIPEVDGLVRRNVAKGSRNFCQEAAMSSAEMYAAMSVGVALAEEAIAAGCNLLGFGEMGIGNTTAASAITAALTGCSVAQSVGRGAGADDECLKRKISAVERALALHQPYLEDPFEILQRVGGLEIAAMCGFCLGAAAGHRPVITDGVIATSAAALAVRMNYDVKDYLFAGHSSVEPAHNFLMEIIGQRPLLSLEMRLGEGTGAALAIPIMQGAAAMFTGMATFESAGVTGAEGEVEHA